MDSKLIKDARLADLVLKTEAVVSKVQDIPGASIVSDNVELELSKFGEDASVVLARSSVTGEIATVTLSGTVATLDFTSAVTAATVIEVFVALKL